MSGFLGAIFDVDGVLVDSPHEIAWRESPHELMSGDWAEPADRTAWAADGFTYDRPLLAAEGADLVVTSLDQVDPAALNHGRSA